MVKPTSYHIAMIKQFHMEINFHAAVYKKNLHHSDNKLVSHGQTLSTQALILEIISTRLRGSIYSMAHSIIKLLDHQILDVN